MHAQSKRFSSSEWLLAVDDELVLRVIARMQTRLGSQVRNFQMSGYADGLILRGQVQTYYSKQIAQEVVMEVSGLAVLANDIEVRRRAATPREKVVAK